MEKSSRHRLIEFLIAFALLVVLFGKITLSVKSNELSLLIFYGISVTLAVWLAFFFAFIIYKDPYITSKIKLREVRGGNKKTTL